MKKRVMVESVLKLLFLCVLMLAFSFQQVKALEPPEIEWSRTYGGTERDRFYCVIRTSGGGYALAGYTESFGAGGRDFWLIKTDAAGAIIWNMTYGGVLDEVAESVVQTSDGGYALAGGTWSFAVGDADFWLVKTDSSGNMEWSQTYGGVGGDAAVSIVETEDGGYALAGRTWSFGAGGWDFWLVTTDSSGNMEWSQTYGGSNTDQALSVVETNDGGYALVGETWSFGAGSNDAWLVKTGALGNVQWDKTYGGTDGDIAWCMIQKHGGGYALAGYTTSKGAGNWDFWLVETDALGNVQWDKTYGGTEDDRAHSIAQTSGGGYALAGYTTSFGVGNKDFWVVKTDSTGNIQWNQTHGGPDNEEAFCVIQTSDGGYAIAGWTASSPDDDGWLIKLAGSPVGGEWIAIDKLELLAPWIGLASLITVASVSVVCVRHRKKQQN